MRRKIILILLIVLFFLLALFGLFAVWTWYQMQIVQSLQTGAAQTGSALGGLVIPQTAVLYALLAGSFLLLTIASIWITYRLVMFSPDEEA
jgi:hypothetical protein